MEKPLRDIQWRATWLDVVEGSQKSTPAKRIKGEMTINCCVDGKDKGGEIHQEP